MDGLDLKITDGRDSPSVFTSPIFTPAIKKIIRDALKQTTEYMHKICSENIN